MTYLTRAALIAASSVLLPAAAPATTVIYEAYLDGPSELPPNASPGTGYAKAIYDDVAHTLKITLTFSDLIGTTTASHIHSPTAVPYAGTAGVATTVPSFAGFPLGVTSGSMDILLDLTAVGSYNPPFIAANGGTTAGAEAALAGGLASGKAYLNIHTTLFGGGEIRGFFRAVAVPEPASWALMIGGFSLCGMAMRRRPRVQFA